MPVPDPVGRFTDYGERFLLAAAGGGWPVSYGWTIRLFTSPAVDPADDDEEAYDPDFIEATFDGYAAQNMSFSTPYLLSTALDASKQQWVSVTTGIANFRHTGDGVDDTNETVYGWYLTIQNAGNGEWSWINTTTPVYYRYFDTSVFFEAFSSPVIILPAFKLFGEEDIDCEGSSV